MENEIEKTEQIDYIEKTFAFFHAEESSQNQNDWTWQKSDKVEFKHTKNVK